MTDRNYKIASVFLCVILLSILLSLYFGRLHNIDLAYNFKNKKDSCELMIEMGEDPVECIEYCDKFSLTEECIPYRDLYMESFGNLWVQIPFFLIFLSLLTGIILGSLIK